jgi:uncharacterized membrane protein YedE/YeeE
MDNISRLHLVARITYYFGWITAVCGALAHFDVAVKTFLVLRLSQRNLFEASIMFFVICVASTLRELAYANRKTMPVSIDSRRVA